MHGLGNVGVLAGIASISAGRYHSCVVLTSGRVDCWGSDDYGQLGDGTTTQRMSPVAIVGLDGSGILEGVA